MSTAIVYEGVPGAQGTLFQGKCYFVTIRVPDRSHIVDLITQNGGKCVKLERNAHFIIADHARPDCPPESLSWEFIRDSVKYGAIQEEDKYQICRSPAASRPVGSSPPVGSSNPVKRTRNSFTTAEDAALVKWVLSQKRTSGNEIYQTFEQMNKNHTWQSWRDRWVKRLSKLPPDTLEKMAAAAPASKPPPKSSPTGSLPGQGAQPTRSNPPASAFRDVLRTPPVAPPAVMQARPDARKPEAPAQVAPAKRNKFTEEDDELKAAPRSSDSRQNSNDEGAGSPGVPTQNVGVLLASGAGKERADPRKSPELEEERDQGDEAGEADESDEGDDESQEITEDDFYYRLTEYRKLVGQEADVEPKVSGRPVNLWLLWEAVRGMYARGGVEVNWDTVAGELGFSHDMSNLLQQCYSEYLARFADTLNGLDDESEDGEQEENQPDEDSLHPVEEVDMEEEDEIRISLPDATPRASRKRQATTMEASGLVLTPNGRGKRQRLGPDDEIPSTPDEKLGISTVEAFGVSPSLSVRRAPRDSTVVEGSEGGNNLPRGTTRRSEPETQDFGFDNEVPGQAVSQGSDMFRISPSEQLPVDEVGAVPVSSDRHARPANPGPALQSAGDDAGDVQQRGGEEADTESQGEMANIAELEKLINTLEVVGHRREDILTALMSTSLCPPLATSVVEHIGMHKSLPKDWEGVWTDGDDKRLRRVDLAGSATDADDAERAKLKKYWNLLVKKHTERRIDQRRRFLAYMDEVQQASQ